ncbi:MAG TPA: PilZ domain-containing protein [Polyangia bacterium]|jgi:Tfp pilus assembly protein PilZ|nr:PilZ domain-containing protein [Polyangia bacterium]
MTILKAHFPTGTAFLERFLPEFEGGGIFFPTRRMLAIGESVAVAIRLGRRRSPTLIRGRVAWRRPGKHSTKIKAGIGIEFLESERQAREYLLGVARGDSEEMVARRHQRLPVELPVMWQVQGVLQDKSGVLRDIGRGGAFVKTEEALPTESDIVLMVSPPGAEVAMPLSARVCWKGHPGGENGFGVEWKARDAGGSRRIKELVRRIEAQGVPARFA